jgi:hypothetical protein
MILSRNRFIDKLETKEPISFQQSIIESQGGSADGALVVLFHPQMDALLVESVTAVQSHQVLGLALQADHTLVLQILATLSLYILLALLNTLFRSCSHENTMHLTRLCSFAPAVHSDYYKNCGQTSDYYPRDESPSIRRGLVILGRQCQSLASKSQPVEGVPI